MSSNIPIDERCKYDSDKFETSINVQQFKPEELDVKATGDTVTILGQHEKNSANSYVSRQFKGQYTLPQQYNVDQMESKIGADGMLNIKVPAQDIDAGNMSVAHSKERQQSSVVSTSFGEHKESYAVKQVNKKSTLSSTLSTENDMSISNHIGDKQQTTERDLESTLTSISKSNKHYVPVHQTLEHSSIRNDGCLVEQIEESNVSSTLSSTENKCILDNPRYDNDKFETNINVQQFKPEELNVKATGDTVIIQGQHKEKSANSYVSTEFTSQYTLPQQYNTNQIESKISAEVVLNIKVPAQEQQHIEKRNTAVTQSKEQQVSTLFGEHKKSCEVDKITKASTSSTEYDMSTRNQIGDKQQTTECDLESTLKSISKFNENYVPVNQTIEHSSSLVEETEESNVSSTLSSTENKCRLDNLRYDNDKFETNINVQQFKPEELNIKATEDTGIIQGQHEEKSGNSYVSTEFTSQYTLPQQYNMNQIESKISTQEQHQIEKRNTAVTHGKEQQQSRVVSTSFGERKESCDVEEITEKSNLTSTLSRENSEYDISITSEIEDNQQTRERDLESTSTTISESNENYVPVSQTREHSSIKNNGCMVEQTKELNLSSTLSSEENIRSLGIPRYESDKFETNINVQQFKPEELDVKVTGDTVTIRGQHEEKGANSYVSTQFTSQYILPQQYNVDQMESKISAEGVLNIKVPAQEKQKIGERNVAVTQSKERKQNSVVSTSFGEHKKPFEVGQIKSRENRECNVSITSQIGNNQPTKGRNLESTSTSISESNEYFVPVNQTREHSNVRNDNCLVKQTKERNVSSTLSSTENICGLGNPRYDSDKFETNINVQQFKPEELAVKVTGNTLIIRGQHEENTANSYVSRQFTRQYTVPHQYNVDQMESKISVDGVLNIKVPAGEQQIGEKNMAVTHSKERQQSRVVFTSFGKHKESCESERHTKKSNLSNSSTENSEYNISIKSQMGDNKQTRGHNMESTSTSDEYYVPISQTSEQSNARKHAHFVEQTNKTKENQEYIVPITQEREQHSNVRKQVLVENQEQHIKERTVPITHSNKRLQSNLTSTSFEEHKEYRGVKQHNAKEYYIPIRHSGDNQATRERNMQLSSSITRTSNEYYVPVSQHKEHSSSSSRNNAIVQETKKNNFSSISSSGNNNEYYKKTNLTTSGEIEQNSIGSSNNRVKMSQKEVSKTDVVFTV